MADRRTKSTAKSVRKIFPKTTPCRDKTLPLRQLGLKPSDLKTRQAFENALTVVIALADSTNVVRRLLAITDGHFSGGSRGFVVGHITPDAAKGGPIGLIENADTITIDAVKNELTLTITGKEFAPRKKAAKPFEPKETLPSIPTSALASIPQTYPERLSAARCVLIDGQREIERG